MTVLDGEGRVPILYGAQALPTPPYPSVYLARPDLDGRYPAVVVVHGRDDATSSAKAACRRLARHGYIAVAGEIADQHASVVALRTDWDDWAADRLAVLGAGTGIPSAQELAARSATALILLGGADQVDRSLLSSGIGPVLGLLAGDPADIAALHEAAGRGKWVRYRDSGPGFHDEGSPDFRAASAKDAYERVIAFLDRHLAEGTSIDLGAAV